MPSTGDDRPGHLWAQGSPWRVLLDRIPTLVYVRDPTAGTLVFVNQPLEQFTGRSEAEILATGTGVFDEFVHPDDFAALGDISAALPLSDDGRDVRARDWSGEWRVISLREQELGPELAGGDRFVLGLATDVTERRRDAEAVAASEAFTRHVADVGPALISVIDIENWQLTFSNARWRSFFGFDGDPLHRFDPGFFRSHLAPHDFDRYAEMLRDLARLPGGGAVENEFRFKNAAGEWRWLHSWDSVFGIGAGGSCSIMSTALDVTEARERDREMAEKEARLQQIQKLESLGLITGGIAHDFNNLLTGILGYADLLETDSPPGSDPHTFASEITRAATRAADLCSRLLTYSGHSSLAKEPTELNAIVCEAEALLRASIPKSTQVNLELAAGPLPLEADPVEIQQVAMNLIMNASEALEANRGTVVVRTGARSFRAEELRSGFGGDVPEAGRCVFLEVEDDGVGMDSETRARIFEPFFSTKLSGRGLGLSVALRIVREHGGVLMIDSEVGQGTRLRAVFPQLENAATSRPATPKGTDVGRLDASILVVDDEESVRNVARRILERAGCRVWEAPDGEAGLAAVRDLGAEIEIALVDLTLPGIHGTEVARAMQAYRAELPVVLMSGFSAEGTIPYHLPFLRKPFDAVSLLGTLRGGLRRAARAGEGTRREKTHSTLPTRRSTGSL